MSSTITVEKLNQCLPALTRFARSLTRNEDRADDLVQDTVERALNKAHLFDGSNLRPWMFTICKRVFLNQIRSAKTKGISVPVEDAPQSRLSVSQEQDMKLHFKDVASAFQDLPTNDRVILSMIVIKGMKYEEAAAALDIPVGTVRSRLSRARSKLEELVADSEDLQKETNMAALV